MDTGIVLGIASLVTALLGGLGTLATIYQSWYETRRQMKKDDAALLREDVDTAQGKAQTLRVENDMLRYDLQKAQAEKLWLRTLLQQNKIEIPPMPADMIPSPPLTLTQVIPGSSDPPPAPYVHRG